MNSINFLERRQSDFEKLGHRILGELQEKEHLTLSLHWEDSLFTRFNQSKVRQATEVQQTTLTLKFISTGRELVKTIPITWEADTDFYLAQKMVTSSRSEAQRLPESHFLVYPENLGHSSENKLMDGFDRLTINKKILKPLADIDMAGVLTSGLVVKANMNSAGQIHWFGCESFYFDYSLYTGKQKAVKGCYAGNRWDQRSYHNNIMDSVNLLAKMELPQQDVKKGRYRTYLAPAAVNEILALLSWGQLSGSGFKQGISGLKDLFSGDKSLSKSFHLYEDFALGLSPRFNSLGELSEELVTLIENGKAVTPLVSSKSAKEYSDLKYNGADLNESPRSPRIGTGQLKQDEILTELGTGLYVSNLHYLNFSDRSNGRITGMTRYACFWVENGEIKGPIKDLRFDETLYNLFGDKLQAITEFSEILPETRSYFERHIGGSSVPGIIVDELSYTL